MFVFVGQLTTVPGRCINCLRKLQKNYTHRDVCYEAGACGYQRFMGMDAVMLQSCKEKPRSTEARRGINPKFFATDKWLRIDAIKRCKQFVSNIGKR